MKLIVFGDFHYLSDTNYDPTNKYYDYSTEFRELKNDFFEFGIKSIFEEEADYYISLGDLTNFGREDELRGVFDLIEETGKKDRFVHVIGNHDLYSFTADELIEMTGQNYNYSVETDEAKLIFINSAYDINFEKYSGHLSQEEVAWLGDEIEGAGEKPCLVFAHHPVYDTVLRSNFENLSIEPSVGIEKALARKKEGQGVFLAGHNHHESIESRNNWTFVNLDAFIDHPKYSLIEIDNTKIEVSSVDIEISEEQEEAREVIGSNMPYFNLIPFSRGTSKHREIKIFI